MRGFRWMVPILFLATTAHAQPIQDAPDTQKLDRLTQKLKKQCEDQGGKFVLESATAKHSAAPLDRPIEGRVGVRSNSSGGALGLSQGGQTAYQASGSCVTTVTIDFAHPPPKP